MGRVLLLSGALAGLIGISYAMAPARTPDGCPAYIPSSGPLIAHAGGGLPHQTYADNLEALDLAAKHGLTVVELDFHLIDGRVRLGHEKISGTTFAQLLQWLRTHPTVTVITDAKTPNVPTLTELVREAGPLTTRFRPQIYTPEEYAAVSHLGMLKPVLTVYRVGDGWQDAANALDLAFVTVPIERKDEARGVRHPIYLHTVNKPMPGYGLYTDCLIPK